MDSPDQYAVKGHDLMRKAQKVLKGTRSLTQDPSSATSPPTNPSGPSKPSNCISKLQQTSSWLNCGTNLLKHT